MKVQKVKIKQFKVLKDLEEAIDGKNIFLMGDNGVGKSSLIQFIQIALGQSNNIPPNAKGSGEVITMKDGKQYMFHVELKDGKSKVKITGPDNLKDDRKSTLATLIGAMDFNINEFAELSKSTAGRKKQVEIFKGFLPPDIRDQIATMETHVQCNFNERTEINKVLKTLEIECQAHPLAAFIDKKLQEYQPVDVGKVFADLKTAQEKNATRKGIEVKTEGFKKEAELKQAEIADLENKIKALRQLEVQALENAGKGHDWLLKNPAIDTSNFEEEINSAKEKNDQHKAAQELLRKRAQLEEQKEASGEMTALIESERGAIADAIRTWDSPIEGLTFDNESLLYNDVPVSNDSLSTSELIELGVRLKMAENPDLGILFIQGGESLGAARLKEILNIAKKADWQVIMEQVVRGKESLTIELIGE